LVEHDLAKVGVAGSSPVSRSGREKRDEKFIPMTIGKSRFSLREREKGREVYPDDYREVPFLAQGERKRDEKLVPITIGESRFSLMERERGCEVYPDDYRKVPPVPTNLSGFLALFLF
jgi:hypothetical protein